MVYVSTGNAPAGRTLKKERGIYEELRKQCQTISGL